MTGMFYFPLGEPEGSTTAGNITEGRSDILTATQVGTGGTLTFGAGTGPSTDGLTAPVFTPVNSLNGLILKSTLVEPLMPAGATTLEFECFVNTTSTNAGYPLIIGDLTPLGLNPAALLNINVAGVAQTWFYTPGGLLLIVAGATVNDGATHHLAGRLVISGGTATVSLMVDGGARVSNSGAYTGPVPEFRTVCVGGETTANLIAATISHVAIRSGTVATSDARITQHALAGLTGFEGESSDARIRRYARLAGIPAAEMNV